MEHLNTAASAVIKINGHTTTKNISFTKNEDNTRWEYAWSSNSIVAFVYTGSWQILNPYPQFITRGGYQHWTNPTGDSTITLSLSNDFRSVYSVVVTPVVSNLSGGAPKIDIYNTVNSATVTVAIGADETDDSMIGFYWVAFGEPNVT